MNWTLLQILVATTLIAFGCLVGYLCHKFLGDPDETPGRLRHLEGLRALAALAVVGCHTTQHVILSWGFTGRPELSDRLGILGVQMFFGLTAFLFTRRILSHTLDVSAFFLGRIRRLVPLYAAVCIAAIFLVQWHHPLAQPFSKTLNELYGVFTFGFLGAPAVSLQGHNMLSLIGAAWTLHYEWCFYVLIPLLVLLVRSWVGVIVASSICLVVMAQSYALTPEVVWPFFLPGVLAAFIEKYLPQLTANQRVAKFLALAAVVWLAASVWVSGYFSLPHVLLSTLLFLCLFLAKPRLLQGATLQYIARISYSIYLLQYLIITPMMGLHSHPGFFATQLAMALYASLVILILVPLSHITYRFIESPFLTERGRPVHTHQPKPPPGDVPRFIRGIQNEAQKILQHFEVRATRLDPADKPRDVAGGEEKNA